jgi:hypothetical protein
VSSKQQQTPRVEIKHNASKAQAPCGLCGKKTDPTTGLEVFLDGTDKLVCRDCAKRIDPTKLRWRDWAASMTAQAAQRAAIYEPGQPGLDFRMLDPIEQPLRCTLCQCDDIRLACVICTMPDRKVAYLGHLGLWFYESNMPDGFELGATMVFRCAKGHLLFRHFSPAGHRLNETRLAAHAGPGVLAELQPLWDSASQVAAGTQNKEGAGE